jgi:DNA-binding MarR family transcriptional regulator
MRASRDRDAEAGVPALTDVPTEREEEIRASLSRSALVPLVVHAHGLVEGHLGRPFYLTPAWDMLIDLYSRDHDEPMQVTSLCMATKAPTRTAQRTIERLVEQGMLVRTSNPDDRRRSMVALSSQGIETLDRLFEDMWALILKSGAGKPANHVPLS